MATDPKRRVMGAQRRPDQLSTGLPRGLGTLTRARPTWTRTAWTRCTCWVTRRAAGSRSNWPAAAGRCRWCRSPRVGSAPRWNVPTRAAVMITTRMINRVRYPWLDELARTPAGRSVLFAGMRAMPWQASPADALTMKDGFADQTGFWTTLWNAIMIDVPTGMDRIDCIVAQGALDVIGSGQTPPRPPDFCPAPPVRPGSEAHHQRRPQHLAGINGPARLSLRHRSPDSNSLRHDRFHFRRLV